MIEAAKKLRATTIIPDSLYVSRDADRQLAAIIEDMGRPGYVLVARQMGKTNLLLRMKRQREASGDLVLYFDLSTRFDSAQKMFRNIIDGFLERLDMQDLADQVLLERTTLELDANAEYDRHIRLALSRTSALRVIVVLDEIDSLVGHDFSDRILSQIRSMYFARANYTAYERLTYVLSGVAEPTDLIKDKNISPFNIGEKIYLSDFSKAELDHLLQKAGLAFDDSVIEAVYEWTNGNPRMVWDICSNIEDMQRAGETPTTASVESVVKKLYLTRYDRPPIDHIRSLAENDQNIRSSLISLLYGKGDTLDDKARSRLYLAGITSQSTDGVPKLKNQIIEQALSESWLAQVEAGQRGLLETASGYHREDRHAQAIGLYEQFIEVKGSGIDSLGAVELFQLGVSYYQMSRLNEAIPALELALEKIARPLHSLRETLLYHLASAHLLSGNTRKSMTIFEDVIELDGAYKLQAKHALSGAYTSLSITNNADKIIQLNREVLTEIEATTDSDANSPEIKTASHYTLARVHITRNSRDQARTELSNAISSAVRLHLPSLSAMVIDLLDDKEAKHRLLVEAVQALLEGEAKLSESPDAFALKAESLGRLLEACLEHKEHQLFASLIDFARKALSGSFFDQVLTLVRATAERSNQAPPLNLLLKYALTADEVASTGSLSSRLEALRLWLAEVDEPDNSIAFTMLSEEIGDNSDLLHEEDIVLFASRLGALTRLRMRFEAEQVIQFARSHQDYFQTKSRTFYLLFLQYEMALHKIYNEESNERKCAQKIMRLTSASSLKGITLSTQWKDMTDRIRKVAQSVLQTRSIGPLGSIGRNEQVFVREKLTRGEFKSKFKKVEERIKLGELEFIRKA